MHKIEFTVRGHLPPKKDGANSMWRKPTEVTRLIALRSAALRSRGDGETFSREIALTLEIHTSKQQLATMGDLDNFITGVCDGLMAIAGAAPNPECWADPALEAIRPSHCIAIRDDREVVEIIARKLVEDSGEQWYRVVLTGQ